MKMKRTRLILAAVMAVAVAGLCAGQARGAAITNIGSGNWNVGGTWSGGAAPGINDDVTITNGCTVTIPNMLTNDVKSLTIQAGGALAHSANGGSEQYKCILNIVNTLDIAGGGKIDVKGKGYSQNSGPGGSPGSTGAGHGGVGGSHIGSYPPSYGSITAPVTLGSGGSTTVGGGAVILTVGGATSLAGEIVADGNSGDYYTGAGGSVFLTTGSLTGSGTISACGGTAGNYGAGAGGRIAVILTGSADFGSVVRKAFGGGPTGNPGAAGTIYLQHTGHGAGKGILIVDNNDYTTALPVVTPQDQAGPSTREFAEIILTNRGVYALDTNDTLMATNNSLRGDPADAYDGIWVNGGTLMVPDAFAFSNYFLGVGGANPTFSPTSSLTVCENATLIMDKPANLLCAVTLLSGAVMTHSANGSTEANKIDLTINGGLDIQLGAQINVDGKGHSAGSGPGKGGANSGGGYGGMGGYHPSIINPGTAYGSITAPRNIGSGGMSGSAGGAVILNVRGATTLNGNIFARDNQAVTDYQGSAGGVFLTTATLAGSGTINACAKHGGYGPGANGRISVVLTNGNDFGSVKMFARYSGTSNGQGSPGTIYTQTKDQGPGNGTLLIDANGYAPGDASKTLIGTSVTDTAVGTVIITNNAVLAVSNQALTVRGDWINKASFIALTNGTVDFAGAAPATIQTSSSNVFYNLTVTNAGKTVSFQAGRTNTVNGLLKLGATGSDPLVTLQSTAVGNQWYLTLNTNGGVQEIRKVSVKDSNAGGGQPLTAGKGSVNELNNMNWLFLKSGGSLLQVW